MSELALPEGVRIGIDSGKARIGVAKSDSSRFLASPHTTIPRDRDGTKHIDDILRLASEEDCRVIYVGDPLNLKGQVTASTEDARHIARELAKTGLTVRMIDERLTTVAAQASLFATGKDTRASKKVIDQAAAAVLLQHALDLERATGKLAGAGTENLEGDD